MAPRDRARSVSGPLEQGSIPPVGKRYVPKDIRPTDPPSVGMYYSGLIGGFDLDKPWYKRLDWLHTPLLLGTPLIALYGLLTTEKFIWQTWAFAFCYYFFTGLGITAGYHRCFAHKAYKAVAPLRVLLLLMGAGAFEGSCRWWSRGHRAHHKYVDTEKDPYSSTKGFFYAHIGWMLARQEPKRMGRADISDLNADPWVMWQHRNYLWIAIFMALGVPTLACGLLFNDWHGGYFIAGVLRLVFVHHSTFFVNSLAHWAGDATYTNAHTARNSFVTALVTLGEGYHNFHHEFPSDYRNGVEWWQYDPTKIFIYTLSKIGLAYDLQYFPRNEIVKGSLQMRQRYLESEKAQVYWGPDPATIPVISQAEFEKRVSKGEPLVIMEGFVLNVGDFIQKHPGGPALIKGRLGADITRDVFEHMNTDSKGNTTGYYKHSNAARNLADTMRVARIEGYWAK